MSWRTTFGTGSLGTVVGRRTLTLFVACALFPTSVLTIAAYRHVRSALLSSAQEGIDAAAKRRALAVIERATWIAQLLLSTDSPSGLTAGAGSALPGFRAAFREDAHGRFVALGTPEDAPPRVAGRSRGSNKASATGATIFVELGAGRVWFVSAPEASGMRIWAEPTSRFLWGFADDEQLTPSVCIVARAPRRILRCSSGADPGVAFAAMGADTASESAYLFATRSVFLGREFATSDWAVVAMQARADVLLPVSRFARTFFLITALCILVVFAVSYTTIRRTTEPLKDLRAATESIARGDFAPALAVRSQDEFGLLATSMLTMSSQLGRQFTTLSDLDALDQAAMGTRDLSELFEAARVVFERHAAPDRLVFLAALPQTGDAEWVLHDYLRGSQKATVRRRGIPSDHLLQLSNATPEESLFELGVGDARCWTWRVFLLRSGSRVEGAFAAGFAAAHIPAVETLAELQRYADRLAVGLANFQLVARLDSLSLGTLTAFARAIDANSPWTAGHSERVTDVAMALGAMLELSPEDAELLRTGSLLHDIGKIGIPAAILNKAGALTEPEYGIIQSHPVLGVRILEPIPAFRSVLPLVRHHHERLDGRGYPDRLRADEIPQLVRILSVADVYDALVSARPYRGGMHPEAALRLMRDSAGRHLDGDLVEALQGLSHSGMLREIYAGPIDTSGIARAINAKRALIEEYV